MTRIFQVEEMTGECTFDSTTNGVPSEVKVIGVKLTDGRNTLYAEAYRERAEQVKKMNLQKVLQKLKKKDCHAPESVLYFPAHGIHAIYGFVP